MTQSKQMLASLVLYQIFHDLISPNETINNGIELLALIGQDNSDYDVSLVADSLLPNGVRFKLDCHFLCFRTCGSRTCVVSPRASRRGPAL